MITLEQLTRRFGDLTAVDRLSLEVAEGELFGIVGPDGAGKTTTLRMLAGVLHPTSGDAMLDGVSVANNPEGVKHHLAYMSQRFGLYTDLTVEENLQFYADLYRVPRSERKERMKRLFEFSGLGPFRERLAGALSGGMKQKLGLSCALIHQPRILLLDEPTFGVDPISRRDLWIIIHEMVAEGVTVMVSTSYMDEAERFDRLVMLHQGRLLALDTPAGLLKTLGGELLSVQVDDVRQVRQLVETIPAVRSSVIFGDALHLTVDSAETRQPEIARTLADAGRPAREITRIEPSLEDIFVERIRRAEEADR